MGTKSATATCFFFLYSCLLKKKYMWAALARPLPQTVAPASSSAPVMQAAYPGDGPCAVELWDLHRCIVARSTLQACAPKLESLRKCLNLK